MNILYGIKNCDTVKKARNWLDQNAIAYRFHDYRSDGVTPDLIRHFAEMSDWKILLNKSSASWRQLGEPEKADMTEDKAVQLMLKTPTIIKRPVLDTGNKVIVGFKDETYQRELNR